MTVTFDQIIKMFCPNNQLISNEYNTSKMSIFYHRKLRDFDSINSRLIPNNQGITMTYPLGSENFVLVSETLQGWYDCRSQGDGKNVYLNKPALYLRVLPRRERS